MMVLSVSAPSDLRNCKCRLADRKQILAACANKRPIIPYQLVRETQFLKGLAQIDPDDRMAFCLRRPDVAT
jgi:hypothetical protein